MSTRPNRVCAVCGAPAPPVFRAPVAEIAPDLDGRPGEPARSTMDRWLQSCRSCGAAAPDLAALPAAARDVIGDGWDRTQSPFLRWAALSAALGDARNQAEALLQAAWRADDAGDAAAASDLRRRVAALWADTTDPGIGLRRLDVLRRSAAFADAERWAEVLNRRAMDENSRRILRFQRARIAASDDARHLISAALPPPAHAPHVTHVQKRPAGLLARWFGRG